MNRSIWLAANAPDVLLSTFPNHRVLNDVFIYFSAWATDLDDTLVYAVTDLSQADADGATMSLGSLITAAAGLMYSDYTGEIRISNAQAQSLQVLPQWSLFIGEYDDKDELQADVTAAGLGITLDQSKTLTVLIAEAKAALAVALGGV